MSLNEELFHYLIIKASKIETQYLNEIKGLWSKGNLVDLPEVRVVMEQFIG